MKYLSQLVLYYSRHFIALLLALFTFFATPAAGQFLSDGVTPVTPIPNSNATLLGHIGSCLAEQPVTGLCTTWGDSSGFGAIPSWDVSNVTDFTHAFLNRTTFDGDISQWDMRNALSLYGMFQNAQAFNQDISGWDVSNASDFRNVFQQANAFNQDIRNWQIDAGDLLTNIFLNSPAMTATYGTHPLYADTPRRSDTSLGSRSVVQDCLEHLRGGRIVMG